MAGLVGEMAERDNLAVPEMVGHRLAEALRRKHQGAQFTDAVAIAALIAVAGRSGAHSEDHSSDYVLLPF